MQNKCFHKVAQCWISIIHFTQDCFFLSFLPSQRTDLDDLGCGCRCSDSCFPLGPDDEFDAAHVFNPCDKPLALLSSPSNTVALAVCSPSAAITDKSQCWLGVWFQSKTLKKIKQRTFVEILRDFPSCVCPSTLHQRCANLLFFLLTTRSDKTWLPHTSGP